MAEGRILLVRGAYGKRLRVEGGAFVVEGGGGEKIKVSPVDVDEIVIEGGGVSVSTAAMGLAASLGIQIYVVPRRGRPPIVVGPVYAVRVVETRRAQYLAREGRLGAEVARALVASRISNQARALRLLTALSDRRGAREALEKLSSCAERARRAELGGDWATRLRSVEADAALSYWGALASLLPRELGFGGRDQEGSDPLNACINYLYALLYGRVFRRLVYAGLDPYAGIYHVDRAGRTSLVYDASEPLKPFVDYWLARRVLAGWRPRLSEGGLLDDESRRAAASLFVEVLARRASIGGSAPQSFDDVVVSLAFRLARALREGSAEPEMFELEWA